MSELELSQRQAILQKEIERQLKNGWQLLANGQEQAIFNQSFSPGFFKTLIFGFLTLGAYAIYSVLKSFNPTQRALLVTVEEDGNVVREEMAFEKLMAQWAIDDANRQAEEAKRQADQ